MIKMYGENYKEYTKDISREEWIENRELKIYWEKYLDVDMYDVKDAITKYCEKERLEFNFNGGCFCCISNRRQHHDIQRLIRECLIFRK